ncbi:MAG TPA: potassium-transporting ATPase subunit KdpC [Candidatus Acidoferrales bacterium]|jgi:K+-transporting ATPase ATPase C chain|nr:potassium-transporting ATPase subunit KdpC [Candidatus Acidoferrales bacterium]
MKKELILALRFTLVTTLVFGLIYPLVVTGLSKMLFPKQAAGSLIEKNGRVVGSKLIGQSFSADKYFHSRPSAAGTGYDASASSPSNLAPTNQALLDRVKSDVAKLQQENPGVPIPTDLVTASGSGLDPEISPAAADFQILRVAKARGISVDSLKAMVARHTQARTIGIFGEPRVNVLELNLDLDSLK